MVDVMNIKQTYLLNSSFEKNGIGFAGHAQWYRPVHCEKNSKNYIWSDWGLMWTIDTGKWYYKTEHYECRIRVGLQVDG